MMARNCVVVTTTASPFLILLLICSIGVGVAEGAGDHAVLSVCVGGDATFHLGAHPQGLQDPAQISWVTEGSDGSPVTVATYSADGQFTVYPPYTHRVSLSEDGERMTLRAVTTEDSRKYTLMTVDPASDQSRVVREVTVNIVGLASSDGDLHVEIDSRAVRDAASGQWVVRLSCGHFYGDSPPSFNVTWTTPSGVTADQGHIFSYYSQGQFHLALRPSTVQGGRYTCSVPPRSFSAACISASGGSQGDGKLEAYVAVQEDRVRLLILEAEHEDLMMENVELRANQTQLREDMKEAVGQLRQEMTSRMTQQTADIQRERAALFQNVSQPLAVLKDKINLLSTRVAFMTQVSKDLNLKSQQRVKLDRVRYNAGDAYDAATGQFTAPVSGTYAFFIKTESGVGKKVYLQMEKEGQRLIYLHAGDDNAYHTPAASVVVHMDKGQRVWVDTADWGTSLVRTWTTFGGFLVRPDVALD